MNATDRSAPAASEDPPEDVSPVHVARAFRKLAKGYWAGQTAPKAWILTGGVGALVLLNVGVALLINRWNKFFFDALERKDVGSVALGVGIVLGLALAAAAVAVALVHVR